MRLHRFFVEDHLRNKNTIDIYDEELIHQWKDVFRLRSGDKILLLDNTGFEYMAEVVTLAKGKAIVTILESVANINIPNKEVWLYAALIKKDNFEWILEKCTELGVSNFVPLLTDRSEKKDLNTERSLKILKEASEQSGRGLLPELHPVMTLNDALTQSVNPNVFHLSGEPFISGTITQQGQVSIFIGPEGGWSDR